MSARILANLGSANLGSTNLGSANLARGAALRSALLFGLLALPFAPSAVGAEEEGEPSVRALIARLGDPSFEVREISFELLLDRGEAAREELKASMTNPDLEVRDRVERLLKLIATAGLRRKVAAFLDDVEGTGEHDLPDWKAFQQLAGNDRPSREFFADMVKAEPALLQAFEEGSRSLAGLLTERTESLQMQTIHGVQLALPTGSVAALLLVGGAPETQLDDQSGRLLINFLNNNANGKRLITGGRQAEMMRRLLSQWVIARSTGNLARDCLFLSLNNELKEPGVVLARKLLEDSKNPLFNSTVQYASILIGKFGSAEDIPLLEQQMENKTVCHSWHTPQFKEIVRVEIRDVMLVMALRLSGQDPKEYGYTLLQETPQTVYHVYTMGYPPDKKAEHDQAFERWKKWREENPLPAAGAPRGEPGEDS